jgi:murein DD-endopeptidase MepM/ murein hydrolase activator NlpD
MRHAISYQLSAVSLLLGASLAAQQVPPLPDSTGWGVHVLALARGPDSSIWVGTYGQGIFVLRPAASVWEHIAHSNDTTAHSISWDFVHAFAFGAHGEIWYGTVGNGWGLSTDGGKTWKNWEFRQLGPEWQYVAPNGIGTSGDTVYIATADGIKVTGDNGATWSVITDSIGATTARDSVIGRIRNQYVLALTPGGGPNLWIGSLRGLAHSPDGGRMWHEDFAPPPCRGHGCPTRIRKLQVPPSGPLVVTTEDGTHRFGREFGGWEQAEAPGAEVDAALRRLAQASPQTGPSFAQPTSVGQRPKHTWFRRPIVLADQPYIDQTYRFGSTMGGNFQPHQGVEFNNPDGTPVHAIGDGVVVYSGPAEAGANTIAIRHDRQLMTNDRRRLYVFSVYYHNTKLLAPVGRRVKTGDVIALVGNTGRATNDHLHLEVHAAPTTDSSMIVRADVRYPPFNANPELWIEPLPGTGVVAGQVWDSKGQPVPQAHVYGLVKPEPLETPFSFIETYGPRNHPDPIYHEHFAISDVPPGEYVLGVEIEGKRVYRRARVQAGKLTWVEFRPD